MKRRRTKAAKLSAFRASVTRPGIRDVFPASNVKEIRVQFSLTLKNGQLCRGSSRGAVEDGRSMGSAHGEAGRLSASPEPSHMRLNSVTGWKVNTRSRDDPRAGCHAAAMGFLSWETQTLTVFGGRRRSL